MTIEQYYNKFNEDHRLQTRHGRVEFEVTFSFIKKFIPQNKKQKILDVGAGTGRYSIAFCKEGHDVTAVELVKKNLDVLRNKHENIKTWQGNAMSLHFLEDNTFDITLVFGPLYHLHGDEQKVAALKEAARVTKKGGLIFSAYVMNDYSVISYCFKEHHTTEVLEKGALSKDFHIISTSEDLYEYVRVEDIDRLNKKAGLESVQLIAADGPADYMRRELNEMTEEEFSKFIEYQKSVCARRELLGASSHCVSLCKKP